MGNLLTSLLNSTNALQVYGRVFNVIQNNIANANTPDYAKQDQVLLALPFDPSVGLSGGVGSGSIVSSRSAFLELAVRNRQQDLGNAQQRANDLAQIEPLFDTSGQSGVPAALSGFFNRLSQLSVNPNDSISRQSVITAAGQVAQAFQQNARGIQQVAGNIDAQTHSAVATINDLASQIANINQQILANAALSQDAGLDTQLNAALENLSQIANFTLIKNTNGSYNVFLGGQTPLVLSNQANPIASDFSTPQTIIRDSQGNDITSKLQGAGGSLGAMLAQKNITLPGYLTSLNSLAKSFADSVNAQLAAGVDKNGNTPTVNFFMYNSASSAASTLAVTNITSDQIAAALPSAPGGNGNALLLAQLANQPAANGFTFTQAYGNLGGQVGRDLSNAKNDQSSAQDLLTQAQQQRATVSGVSLDEEAAKLLQFQQGYQAIGKLVSVLDNLTQTIINMVQ